MVVKPDVLFAQGNAAAGQARYCCLFPSACETVSGDFYDILPLTIIELFLLGRFGEELASALIMALS